MESPVWLITKRGIVIHSLFTVLQLLSVKYGPDNSKYLFDYKIRSRFFSLCFSSPQINRPKLIASHNTSRFSSCPHQGHAETIISSENTLIGYRCNNGCACQTIISVWRKHQYRSFPLLFFSRGWIQINQKNISTLCWHQMSSFPTGSSFNHSSSLDESVDSCMLASYLSSSMFKSYFLRATGFKRISPPTNVILSESPAMTLIAFRSAGAGQLRLNHLIFSMLQL